MLRQGGKGNRRLPLRRPGYGSGAGRLPELSGADTGVRARTRRGLAMLNENIRLVAGASHGAVGVSWTAPGDDSVSWLFVDGRMAAEAFAPGMAERAIDVPLAAGAQAVIEVHDFDPADLPDAPAAIAIPPKTYTRPLIRFAAVPGIIPGGRYRLYHRPEGGAETRVWESAASPDDGEWIDLDCPIDLAGRSGVPGNTWGWHFFRVEAVSAYGVESLAQAWAWRAMDIPAAPRVTVATGTTPGTWTFSVGG